MADLMVREEKSPLHVVASIAMPMSVTAAREALHDSIGWHLERLGKKGDEIKEIINLMDAENQRLGEGITAMRKFLANQKSDQSRGI